MKEDWDYRPLGELGTLTSSKRIYKKEYVTKGVPFYRSKEIKELAHGREISLELFISHERYNEIKSQYGIPQEGDLLLTAVGTIGEMYVVKKNETDFYFKDGNIMWLKNFDSLDPYFLKYNLTFFVEQLKAMSQGSAYKALTIEKLKKYSVPKPSIPEQQQIVAILDKAFEAIDQAKVNIEQNIDNAKELFQSKLNQIFSQKSEGWDEKKIIELCDHKSQIVGGPFGSNLKVKDYKDSGVPILRLQNIGKGYFIDKAIKYISPEKAEELVYHSFEYGDIVLAKLGIPIGKTCIVPEKFKYGIVVADVVRIRPNKKIINYDFLKHFLNSDNAVNQLSADIKGATRPRVNIAEVRNLKLSVPLLSEQESITKHIDALENLRNKQVETYERKANALEELKKSILHKVFAGELTQKGVAL